MVKILSCLADHATWVITVSIGTNRHELHRCWDSDDSCPIRPGKPFIFIVYWCLLSLQLDTDGNGHITNEEVAGVLTTLNEGVPDYQIRDLIREADIDKNGTVEFNEFLKVFTCNCAYSTWWSLPQIYGKIRGKLAETAGNANKWHLNQRYTC